MSTTARKAPRTLVTKGNAFYSSLSPPLWKDQLRQRCLERVKQNRHELLAKLRSPDANMAEEMKRLVYTEEKRREGANANKRRSARRPVFDMLDLEERDNGEADHDDALATIDDLMATGKLSEQDYLDIVHSLEDELRNEWEDAGDAEERLAAEMIEFEEASLAAMLAGMDLESEADLYDGRSAIRPPPPAAQAYAVHDDDGMEDGADAAYGSIHVLCPICKAGSLRESTSDDGHHSTVFCCCGFSLRVNNILHGALEDLQEKIANAFMAHRENCSADPTFAVVTDLDGENEVTDSLLMCCDVCWHECLVR